jgi:hypothetical protein
MNKSFLALAGVVLLAACGAPNNKKALVLLQGKSTANEETKTITLGEGTANSEKTLNYNSAEKVTLAIKGSHEASVDLAENGYYLVNATADTVVGSYQKYGAPKTSADVITQETLKRAIDSLQQLTQGKNVSAANRNFYLLPYSAIKITANTEAFFVAPYHQMTSITKEEGKDPEVYRFYSLAEIRQNIAKMEEATKPASAQ